MDFFICRPFLQNILILGRLSWTKKNKKMLIIFQTSWWGLLDIASMMTLRKRTIWRLSHLGQVCITFHGPVLSDHLPRRRKKQQTKNVHDEPRAPSIPMMKIIFLWRPHQIRAAASYARWVILQCFVTDRQTIGSVHSHHYSLRIIDFHHIKRKIYGQAARETHITLLFTLANILATRVEPHLVSWKMNPVGEDTGTALSANNAC